ncbi:MAG: hypothetical protein OXI54_09560 [Chloroflexota bacterium]|nr:hypothetical protein [Chloroflexota bacterium]MDE2684381.1 hypothetical protein [Chloroflexota bacterium]
MTTKDVIPENIQTLLDRADLSLLRGKHGEASTLFWKATEAAIQQAAAARGHKLRSLEYDDVEPFIDGMERKTGVPLVSGYLNALEFERNGDGDLMDLEDVVFYEPVIRSFISRLLAA